jgi:hypothetical protein
MTDQIQITPDAPKVMNPGTVHEPSAIVPNKTIAIHLINSEDMHLCQFWLGLFQGGKLTPPTLLNVDNCEDVFRKAASEGLCESGPVMLTDSNCNPARFYYLLPEPGQNIPQRASWLHSLVHTVKSWSPEKCGIYLAPDMLTKKDIYELLEQIMHELVLTTETTDYFLMTSSHGLNCVLSSALKIKAELEPEDVRVYVFH